MCIEKIRKKNPDKIIYEICDNEFLKFGKVLSSEKWGINELIRYVDDTLTKPLVGTEYIVDIEDMHLLSMMDKIKHNVYGDMDIECGICHGHNSVLLGLEFHQGSEVNIAITDFILALARKEDMKDNKIYGNQLKLFYVPAGSVIELYDKTLHYCPFSSNENGFSCIVVLLDKTNTTITYQPYDMLVKRNKWFITHKDNKAKIEAKNIIGLLGEVVKIKA